MEISVQNRASKVKSCRLASSEVLSRSSIWLMVCTLQVVGSPDFRVFFEYIPDCFDRGFFFSGFGTGIIKITVPFALVDYDHLWQDRVAQTGRLEVLDDPDDLHFGTSSASVLHDRIIPNTDFLADRVIDAMMRAASSLMTAFVQEARQSPLSARSPSLTKRPFSIGMLKTSEKLLPTCKTWKFGLKSRGFPSHSTSFCV